MKLSGARGLSPRNLDLTVPWSSGQWSLGKKKGRQRCRWRPSRGRHSLISEPTVSAGNPSRRDPCRKENRRRQYPPGTISGSTGPPKTKAAPLGAAFACLDQLHETVEDQSTVAGQDRPVRHCSADGPGRARNRPGRRSAGRGGIGAPSRPPAPSWPANRAGHFHSGRRKSQLGENVAQERRAREALPGPPGGSPVTAARRPPGTSRTRRQGVRTCPTCSTLRGR